MELFRKLSHNGHVHDLSNLSLKKIIFGMMSNGQTNLEYFYAKNMIITSRQLQLLHKDPISSTKTESL